MASLRQFLQRLVSLFRSARSEHELNREIESHLALLEEQFIAQGVPADDAKLAARRSFGGIDQAKERQRDARSFRWIADLPRDVTYAFRSLRKHRAFTAAAVLTLAMGIGATTAIYSVVDTVLLRPLPFAGSDRIVAITEQERPRNLPGINYQEFLEWRKRTTTLEAMAAYTFNPQLIMATREGTVRLTAASISTNYFEVLGVSAALGRVIAASDEADPDVVVLSHGAWRAHFRSNPNAVGSVIELRGNIFSGPSNLGATPGEDGRLLTVVGVLPEKYDIYGMAFELYLPLAGSITGRPPGVTVAARLREGVMFAAAQEEANAIGSAVRSPRPSDAPALTVPRFRVSSMKDDLVEPIRPALRVFLVAVGVMLLIVCANVANLLMARGTARAREIAVRLAIGASRARVMRQIMTECLVLAGIGGVLGALLGAAGVSLIKQLATINAQGVFRLVFGGNLLPRLQEVAVDGNVLLTALMLSMLASALFGVLPAWQLSRVSQLQALGARTSGGARRETRARTALVVSQLVLATVLLVGAGLLVNSFMSLSRVEKGYDPANVVAFQLVLPAEYATDRKAATIESLLGALRKRPEVDRAGFAYAGILLGLQDTVGVFIPPGRTVEEMQAEQEKPRLKSLSPGYLETMGAPLLSGRFLDQRDGAGAVIPVVVNRTVATRYFDSANPVGQTLVWRTAIGIYGVLAYAVVQRTQEIGVRMALGAERRRVMALILRRGVTVSAIGITVGIAGAFAGARYMQSMLFGVEPRDPSTFAAVAVAFALVAVAASYLPARRATQVDPMVALRVD